MPTELDHIFICCSPGGAEAELLSSFGLFEGPPNTHPGQGTACRRFFFANAYLELLWVSDAAEAQSATALPTGLWDRWSGQASGHCGFGFAFRPSVPFDSAAPFDVWEYRPPYLPPPLSIQVATSARVPTEPLLFFLPFGLRLDSQPKSKLPPLSHPRALRSITRVTFTTPHAAAPSAELQAVTCAGLIQLSAGPDYLLEIGFDGESHGGEEDFRPSLPLLFRS